MDEIRQMIIELKENNKETKEMNKELKEIGKANLMNIHLQRENLIETRRLIDILKKQEVKNG